MNYKELLNMLEIESPEDFQYFENLADLLECEENISDETVTYLLKGVDFILLSELIENYFDEISESIPGEAVDLYTLLTSIKMCLAGMAKNMNEETEFAIFSDEFNRFRQLYTEEAMVCCEKKDGSEIRNLSLRDALVLSRIEKFENDEFLYDFEEVLSYEITDYAMNFADMLALEKEEEEQVEGDFELADGYVYDDEFSDED